MYKVTVTWSSLTKEEQEISYYEEYEQAKEYVKFAKMLIKNRIKRIEIEHGYFERQDDIYLETY